MKASRFWKAFFIFTRIKFLQMNIKLLRAIAFFALSIPVFSQTLDPDFGSGGKVTTHLGDVNDSVITDAKFLPDGKILVCGQKEVGYMNKLVVARYLQNGTLDPDFGVGGMSFNDLGTNDGSAHSLWLSPDGKFYVAGEYLLDYWSDEADFMIARYNANGTLDTNFGVNGTVMTDVSGNEGTDRAFSMCIDVQGRIIVAGEAQHTGGNGSYNFEDFAVVRYNSDGAIDTSFATNGVFKEDLGDNTSPLTGSVDIVYQVKTQTDGKIVLCGISDAGSSIERYNLAMMRFNENGSPDETFGTQGKVIMDLGGVESFRSFHILPNGKFILAGKTYINSGPIGSAKIVCLNDDGSPDMTFGNAGVAENSFDAAGSEGIITDSFILPDGKILAVGAKVAGDNADAMALRFDADGSLDESFGTAGHLEVDFFNDDDYCMAMDVNAGGDLLMAGGSVNPIFNVSDFALAKFVDQDLSAGNFHRGNFSVYPNPFSNTLHLDFNLAESAVLSADLVDMNGRTITTFFEGLNFISGANTTTFSMPETLAKGIYFFRIFDGRNVSNIKIVK
jgi:uncharacterized delta-60 repeat protein